MKMLFFRKQRIKLCGGLPSDREDTKTCAFRIEKASGKNSGEYGCMVTNFMKCSIAPPTLKLGGKYDNLVYCANIDELLKIILNCFNKD